MHACLSSQTDLAGFRDEARVLLAHQVPPDEVQWETRHLAGADLFAAPPASAEPSAVSSIPKAATALVPASFMRLCEVVVLHEDPRRFALLYRLLWRLVHEPTLRHDPIDPDMLLAQQMAQAVRRDIHKMKAFLRFRPVPDDDRPGEMLHLAWFEPAHHIVEAVAPWFAHRFAGMHWAILTPERSVHWDGRELRYAPGAKREDAPRPDDGEQLLTAYRSVFDPARQIPELAGQALPRRASMIEQLAQVAPPQQDGIGSLEELKAATMRCRECPIGAHATQSVIGEGRLRAALMLVGEQPGDQEDLQGHPFVGPAGRLLDRALEAVGVPREAVFVSNAVKHFKFELRGKRRIHKSPTQREAGACLHWLEDEIALVRPKALVALGATAARSLLGRTVSVTAARGTWMEREDGLRVLVTLHPSALLRVPPEERDAAFAAFVADLRHARKLLG
jgi:DNA polymerase